MRILRKDAKGITLIALVITIILLLILAGITIVQLTGSGLFGNAKIAKERTRYGIAKEIVELKLMEIETECIKKDENYTLAKVADGMKDAKDITIQNYYYKNTSKVKEGLNRETGELEAVAVSVDEYKEYIFLIGKRSENERIGIIGAVKGEKSDIEDTSKFEPIYEFEEKILGGTAGGNGTGDTEKEPEDVEAEVPGISDDIDLSNPIELTTYIAVKSNTNNSLKLTGVEDINYAIESTTENVSFENGILTANKNADSTDSCKITITGKYQNQSYTNHLTIYVEPKNITTVTNRDENEEEAYAIYTIQDLERFKDLINHNIGSLKNALMMNDINLIEVEWKPILGFTEGIFDGGNYTIKNMKINNVETSHGGAFIVYMNNGIIRNLNFDNPDVYSEGNCTAIAVALLDNSSIENVKILNGEVEAKNNYVGGICGSSRAVSKIKNCSNNATIISNGNNVGGIAGSNDANYSTIENCYNTGTIMAGGHSNIGGIVGLCINFAKISSCYNLGEIINNTTTSVRDGNIGGIVGLLNNGEVEYCYNLKNVLNNNTSANVGGIVGASISSDDKKYSIVKNCYNKANTTSYGVNVGGLLGYNGSYSRVNNCYILDSAEIKYETTLATTPWGSSNNYLGKLVGAVSYTSSPYIINVTSIDDTDIPTVYDVLNKFSEGKSSIWSDSNLNHPKLIWEENKN